MKPPLRLSITWQTRVLNGLLTAGVLTALVVLAQVRIRVVLYAALDRTLYEQARGFDHRPPDYPPYAPPPDHYGLPPDDFGDGGGPALRTRSDGAPPFGEEPHGGGPPRGQRPLRFGMISLLHPRFVSPGGANRERLWSQGGYDASIRGDTDQRDEVTQDGRHIRVVSLRLPTSSSEGGGVIQTAALLEPTDATLREITATLYGLLLPLVIFAVVLGAFLTELALRPVRRLAQAVGGIEPGDLSARLPEPGGGDSFDMLARLMNALLRRLEGAFERQKRFSASASHELRTPLAVIKGATSLLLEDPESLTPLQQRALDRADQSADRANRLITDLLTLTRTENGTLPARLSLVNIAALTREVVEELGDSVVPVVVEMPEGMTFRTDPDHLRRLLQNLLANALRHTRQGRVTVSAGVVCGRLRVAVQDTGEGIAPDVLPRLGEPFYRPDTARGRESGGSGLGLSLCRGIVTSLGGTMKIESTVGLGTSVTITL